MSKYNVKVLSVVPSPYQRDLFLEVKRQSPEFDFTVDYLETSAPDSPWKESQLEPWEQVLPNSRFTIGERRLRSHFHWPVPDYSNQDLVIFNIPTTALTTQILVKKIRSNFLFWGEVFSIDTSSLKYIFQKTLINSLKKASGFICVGSDAVNQYKGLFNFPDSKVHNLPYYCDLSSFRGAQSTSKNHNEVNFLFVGQMIKRKGFDLFIRAFDQLSKKHPNARATIIGRADVFGNNILAQTDPKTLAKIENIGFVEPADLPNHFSSANVFVLPSRHDGWGVVINQAIGAGLPVLASNQVGAAKDFIEIDNNGLIHEAGDWESLSSQMEKMMDSHYRKNFAEGSKEMATKISLNAGASKLKEIVIKHLPYPIA